MKGHTPTGINIQADDISSRGPTASLTSLEHTSDTQLIFPFWAQSSGCICKVSRRVWPAGEAFRPTQRLTPEGASKPDTQDTAWKSLWWLPPGTLGVAASIVFVQIALGLFTGVVVTP